MKTKIIIGILILLIFVSGCTPKTEVEKRDILKNDVEKEKIGIGREYYEGYEVISGKINVNFKKNISENKIMNVIAQYNSTILRKHTWSSGDITYELNIPEDKTVNEMIEIFQLDPAVESVEPDRVIQVHTI